MSAEINGETVLFFRNFEDDKPGEYFYPIQLSGSKRSEIEAHCELSERTAVFFGSQQLNDPQAK